MQKININFTVYQTMIVDKHLKINTALSNKIIKKVII